VGEEVRLLVWLMIEDQYWWQGHLGLIDIPRSANAAVDRAVESMVAMVGGREEDK